MIPNNCSITIQSPTTTADSVGGQSKSFATAQTVSGMLQPASGKQLEEASRRKTIISHVFYAHTRVATATGYRVVIASGNYAGTYLVKWSEDQAGMNRVFAIYLLQEV